MVSKHEPFSPPFPPLAVAFTFISSLFSLALAQKIQRNLGTTLNSPADSLPDREVDSLLALAGVVGTYYCPPFLCLVAGV